MYCYAGEKLTFPGPILQDAWQLVSGAVSPGEKV